MTWNELVFDQNIENLEFSLKWAIFWNMDQFLFMFPQHVRSKLVVRDYMRHCRQVLCLLKDDLEIGPTKYKTWQLWHVSKQTWHFDIWINKLELEYKSNMWRHPSLRHSPNGKREIYQRTHLNSSMTYHANIPILKTRHVS